MLIIPSRVLIYYSYDDVVYSKLSDEKQCIVAPTVIAEHAVPYATPQKLQQCPPTETCNIALWQTRIDTICAGLQ